ncbi:WD40-repeat-containing domain protein, partial [Scheffersomyces xylosifermentans]|uniref:WD40-repeat-containing domain protein n=1 Tax=Scheffersomyces xylosifermentans TaxID=1304137 RepID=UPI00315C743C
MAQAQLVTPPSSKASSSFSKFSPTSSESQTSPSKRGLFNKILRKRSTSSASKKSPLAFTSSASSNSTKVNSITNSERSANVPTSNGSNPRKVHRTGSVRSSRSSKQRSLSEPGIIDDDTASLFDDDADSEDDKDAPANYDSDSSFNSTLSLGHSISIGSIEKSRPAGTLDAPGYDSIYNEKVKFPTLETNNLDNVPTNVPRDEDAPWVGLTYEALIAPKYTRTSKRNKHSPKVLNNLFLAQELNPSEKLDKRSRSKTNEVESPSNGSVSDDETALASDSDSAEPSKDVEDPTLNGSEILVMEFSRDGMFLAAAGHDSNITIWKVISSPLGRLEYKNAERDNKNSSKKSKIRDEAVYTSAPVFHQKPIRVFKGHTNSILTLDWSKNNFLISGSMDRTAKLWHVDREECLKTFQHEDFVTTAKFHPTDDRFFLSGSLDNQARLWSILENNVAFNKNLGDDALITALAFTPDGKYCVVGGFNGSIFVLETKGLYVINRSEIKEKSIVHPFQNKNGNKITGVKIFENPHYKEVEGGDPLQRWTFLITTNDSKVRLVSSTSKKLVTRFKGLTNNSSAIVASMTDDYHYIISGSEDHWCYVWENNNSVINNKVKVAIRDLVTESRHHISDLSHKHKRYAKFIQDNKFVKKVLEDENAPYEFVSNENNSYTAFHAHHSKVNVAIFAPENTKKLLELSDDIIYDLVRRGNACKFKDSDKSGSKNCEKCAVDPRTSAAEDNELTNGHIIVTTDQYGLIRVFRQDSAYKIRKRFVEIYKQGE